MSLDPDNEKLELLREPLAERRKSERKMMEIDKQRLNQERECADEELKWHQREHDLEKSARSWRSGR